MGLKIILNKIIMSMPKSKESSKVKKPTISDRVKKYMDDIENEQKPEVAWKKLIYIYEYLTNPKCKYKYKETLLKKLVPFIAKYGDMGELKDHKYLMKD